MASMTFDEYRSRISIAEMAEHLGYWRNPEGGVSKPSYFLGDKKNPQDEIIIYNISNPAKQTYFSRKGVDKGNLINFIENRLDQFWEYTNEKGFRGVNEVLSKYLHSPQQIATTQQGNNSKPVARDFNVHYWNPRPLPEGNTYLQKKRKLSNNTIADFRSGLHIYEVGKHNHVAFPFRTWPNMDINNFEMRNFFPKTNVNYKGFPAGGNRTTSVWLATFVPDEQVTGIYVFESAVDAMSFYEIHHFTKETTAGFVSTGGTITQNQITPLMNRFPNVKWYSCMDKDASGNIFDVSLAHYLKGEDIKGYTNQIPEVQGKFVNLAMSNGDKFSIHEDFFSSTAYLREKNITGLDIIKPGRGKDWNDLLMYYKRFDLNLSPMAKISLSVRETLSKLNLHGYHALTTAIEKDSELIVDTIFRGSQYPLSVSIAETNAYSLVLECNLKMKCAEFVVEPHALHVIDKITQQQIAVQPLYETLQKERVNLLKDFHSDDLRKFLEKNTLSITRGGVEKSFERVTSPSGWGLKESSHLKKNSVDLDNCL